MEFDGYSTVYLLSNVFGTYTIFKFMGIFFERDGINKKIEFFTYTLYYIIIGFIYIAFNTPILNLVSNLIMFFLLTFNYRSALKIRLTATTLIYVILLSVEVFVVFALKLLNLNRFTVSTDVELITALISTKILSYIVVLVLSNFKMIKNEINISPLHWLAVIIIPLGTMFSTFMLINAESDYKLPLILTAISILFIINVFVFYLYDALIKSYHEKMEKELLHQQNNAYIKQLKIINQAEENIKIFRHDIKNHMSVLQALIEKHDNTGALQYLQSVFNFINCNNEYVKSGNIEVDSILNYKLNEAEKRGIGVEIDISIPEKLNIEPFDVSIILGNLLDNAIEAASTLKKDRTIKVSVKLDRNVFYVDISNSFDGNLIYEDGELKTTHNEKQNHGFGLNSVKKVIDKYNGTINLSHTDSVFYVNALIYNSANTHIM